MWLDPNQTTYCLPSIGPVLVSHWTWAASGRGMVFRSQGNPKRDSGWRLLLTAFPQQGQVFYLGRLWTVLLLIHSSLPVPLTSPLFIHLRGEFPPDSIGFFLRGKTYRKVVTEMNYNLLPSAYSWSQGWKLLAPLSPSTEHRSQPVSPSADLGS